MTDAPDALPDLIDTEADLPENEPDEAEVAAAQPYEESEDEEAPFKGDPRQSDPLAPEPTTPDGAPEIAAFATLLRTNGSALDWALGQHLHPYRSWYRDCLMFVHECFNAPSYYSRAEYGYYGADFRHTTWPPPAAVPVWWTDGGYGHVAISAGYGYCWSNDFVRSGRIDKVRIASITSAWGKSYRGWSEDINKTRIYHSNFWVLDVSNTVHAARNKIKIQNGAKLKHAIAAEVGKGQMNVDNSTLGVGFKEQYQKLQVKYLRSTGQPVTKTSADGIPGRSSLTWLGARHDFYVH